MKPDPKTDKKKAPKRRYEKPAFVTSLAFERQALSCAGCLNQAMGPPAFCGMQS
jgi:hypothetical protein